MAKLCPALYFLGVNLRGVVVVGGGGGGVTAK